MGRAKLKMELITKERSRNMTFKKRKEGLIRKLHEFTTLCDVPACMIVYGPSQEKGGGVEQLDIWPQNPDEVRRMIDIYKAKSKECPAGKNYGLSDFFQEKKRRVEDELEKLRKRNVRAKYPTRLEGLSFLSEGELRDLGVALSRKVEFVKARIEILRKTKLDVVSPSPSLSLYSQGLYSINQNYHHQVVYDPVMMNQNNPMEMFMTSGANIFLQPYTWNSFYNWVPELISPSPSPSPSPFEGFYNSTLNYHHDGEFKPTNQQQESMGMLMMNGAENNCLQFNSDSRNTFYGSMYEPGLLEPVITQPVALDNCPTMLLPAPGPQPPYMQGMDMAPPPLQSYSIGNHGHQHCHGQGSFAQHQMMNQGLGYLQ